MWSLENVVIREPGVLSVSQERETEWKDDTEDAGTCLTMILGGECLSNFTGGYVWGRSTVRESEEMEGLLMPLLEPKETSEADDVDDFRDVNEGFRGGSGGAARVPGIVDGAPLNGSDSN